MFLHCQPFEENRKYVVSVDSVFAPARKDIPYVRRIANVIRLAGKPTPAGNRPYFRRLALCAGSTKNTALR